MIVMKKHIAAAVLIIIAVAVVFYGIKKYESSQTFADSDLKIILDAGHGDPDGGAVGVNGTLEKDINLAIVQKLQEVLEGKGAEVILTREGSRNAYGKNGGRKPFPYEKSAYSGNSGGMWISVKSGGGKKAERRRISGENSLGDSFSVRKLYKLM